MSPLEWLAAALGLCSVWLTTRQNPLCWPIGLLMVLLYGALFLEARLYSLVLLHGVFALMQLYGWWQWRQGVDERGRRPVTAARPQEILLGLPLALLAGGLLGFLMASFSEAQYPWLDAQLTAFSLLAQLWMALKRWHCWLLWIAVDVLYVGFFAWQSYWLTAGLYALFVLLAMRGLQQWRASQALPA